MSTPTWNDITSAPEWGGLNPDQRNAVRQSFFADVVRPAIPDDVDADSVLSDFNAKTNGSMVPQPGVGARVANWVGRAGMAAASRAVDLGATLEQGLNPGASIAATVAGIPDAATPAGQGRALAQRIAPTPAAAGDIAARSADFVGGLIPDAAAALITGGASELPEAASLAARGAHGALSMALPAAENTRDTFTQSRMAGLDLLDASKRAAVAGAGTLAMGAVPGAVAGSLPTRLASGAAIGVGQGEAQRAAMNAVSPANRPDLQQGFDPVGDALSALAGGTFGGVLGGRAKLQRGDDLLAASAGAAPVAPDVSTTGRATAEPTTPAADIGTDAGDTATPAVGTPIDPGARALAAHTARVADLATQLGLDQDQAQAVTKHLAPEVPRDPVTGTFYTAPELTPTLQAAQGYVNDTGQPARYAEIDVANLGGLNAELGHTAADAVLGDIARATHEELQEAGAHVVPIRRGGDEFGFVIQGGNSDDVQAALDRAQMRAQDIAKQYGVDAIPHPKGGAPGVGIVAAHEPITPGQALGDMFRNIDLKIESTKGRKQKWES